jgi:hypothetical protein
MKPFGEYPTAEQMLADWTKSPGFLKLSADESHGPSKRTQSIPWAKEQWIKEHAHLAQQQGATTEDIVGKAKDIIGKVLDMAVGGSKMNVPGRLTAGAVKMMLPDDATQLAIDLAMFGVGPEAVAGKAAYKLLAPIGAGAVGAMVSGKSATEGAMRGAGEMIGGKIAEGGARGIGYMLRKKALPDLDFHRLSGWLEKRFDVKVPDMPTLRQLVYNGQLPDEMEEQFQKVHAKTNKALGKQFRLQIPTSSTTKSGLAYGQQQQGKMVFPMSLDDALFRLNNLEKEGWNLRGEPGMEHAGAAARDSAHEAEGDIANQISNAGKAGADWYTAHGRLKEARAMRNLFTTKDAMDENGAPNFTLLQQLVDADTPTSHRYDLIQGMGEDGHKSFRDMLFRGAPEGSPGDRPSKWPLTGLRVSAHGFYAHPALPYPARHVGDVPYSLGEGRALRALATIGPYQMLNNFSEMFTMPTMHINKTPAEAAATPAPAMPATNVVPAN